MAKNTPSMFVGYKVCENYHRDHGARTTANKKTNSNNKLWAMKTWRRMMMMACSQRAKRIEREN